jgi:lysophospholipase L1-like esterase
MRRRLAHVGSRQLMNGFSTDSNSSAPGKTFCAKVALPVTDAYAIRPVFQNHTATDITSCKVIASCSANPVENFNNAGTWVAATWSGSATGTIAQGTATAPKLTATDFIPLEPIARSDALPSTIYHIRLFVPNTNATVPGVANNTGTSVNATWGAFAGNEFRQSVNVGDFVASPGTYTEAGAGGAMPLAAVEFLTPRGVITISVHGDSIDAGFAATRINSNALVLAAESKSTALLPIVVRSLAQSGTDGSTYTNLAEQFIAANKPTIAVFRAGSPNDGTPTAAIILTKKYNVLRFLKVCQENDTLPVLKTELPRATSSANTTSQYNAAQDDLRKGFNDWVRAICAAGHAILLDEDALLSNNAAYGVAALFGSATYTTDGLHLSDAAYALAASNATYGAINALLARVIYIAP